MPQECDFVCSGISALCNRCGSFFLVEQPALAIHSAAVSDECLDYWGGNVFLRCSRVRAKNGSACRKRAWQKPRDHSCTREHCWAFGHVRRAAKNSAIRICLTKQHFCLILDGFRSKVMRNLPGSCGLVSAGSIPCGSQFANDDRAVALRRLARYTAKWPFQ
jgi:hypothetical protein